MSPLTMTQVAPYPLALDGLVKRLVYKPEFEFWLEDTERDNDESGEVVGRGLTLVIVLTSKDTYHSERTRQTAFYFIVPAATYNEQAWRRWLFDQIMLVELHEAMEYFRVCDEETGEPVRPYAPTHGPGYNPLVLTELRTDEEERTQFDGTVKSKS